MSYHRPFPTAKTIDITDNQVYFFLWQYKSHTPIHTIFYRILPSGNIGVIEIIGPGKDKDICLRDALQEIRPLIKREIDETGE